MTAVEFFFKELKLWYGSNEKLDLLFEQAKEMEQGKICLAFLEGQNHNEKLPSQYYIETYGSKGSDEIKKAEEMGLYDKIELANPNDSIFTSSQIEMLDEEIDRRFNEKKLEQLILLLESRSKELENEFNSKNDIEGLTAEQSRYAKIKKIGESEGINLCVLQIKNLLKLK